MKIFRRRKLIVNKNFQLKFVAFFLFQAFVITLLTISFLTHINLKYGSELKKLEYNSKVLNLLINNFVGNHSIKTNFNDKIKKEIIIESLIFAIFIFFLVLIPSILASHRIAGPLYRLNKIIKDISRGLYTNRIIFRKKDAFKNLEENLNDMLANLNYKKNVDLQDIDNMIQKIIFLIKKTSNSPSIKEDIYELRDILLKMKKRKKYND